MLPPLGQWGNRGPEPLSPGLCNTVSDSTGTSYWLLGWFPISGFSGLLSPAISPSPNSKTPVFIFRWRRKTGREDFAADDSHVLSSTSNSPEVAVRYFRRGEFLTYATGSFQFRVFRQAFLLGWMLYFFLFINLNLTQVFPTIQK